MFSIGELSKATRLTVKALRFYHELGLLEPARIDPQTGYRYYDRQAFERARAIEALKGMGFTLQEMRQIFSECRQEGDIGAFVKRKLAEIEGRLEELAARSKRLRYYRELLVSEPLPAAPVSEGMFPGLLVAGIEMKGSFDQIATGFFQLIKRLRGRIRGKPLCLHFDLEFNEEDARFMPCFQVEEKVAGEGITCLSLPPSESLSVVHRGPYEGMGGTYAAVFDRLRKAGGRVQPPVMERYLRGPGIVFRGNPRGYLTEITLFFARARPA